MTVLDWFVGVLAALLIAGLTAFFTCLMLRIRFLCSLAKSSAVLHTVSMVYGSMGIGREIYLFDQDERFFVTNYSISQEALKEGDPE